MKMWPFPADSAPLAPAADSCDDTVQMSRPFIPACRRLFAVTPLIFFFSPAIRLVSHAASRVVVGNVVGIVGFPSLSRTEQPRQPSLFDH